jgi:hypothetical protein
MEECRRKKKDERSRFQTLSAKMNAQAMIRTSVEMVRWLGRQGEGAGAHPAGLASTVTGPDAGGETRRKSTGAGFSCFTGRGFGTRRSRCYVSCAEPRLPIARQGAAEARLLDRKSGQGLFDQVRTMNGLR